MLTFKHALATADIDPSEVCLLRHQDNRADAGRNPYQLFLNDREAFDEYQSAQGIEPTGAIDEPTLETLGMA